MKTIIPLLLSCLLLSGCSREENLTFAGGTTMRVHHRKGDALEGVHLDMKANGKDWLFDAKTGDMSDEPDGIHVVLYDVQADMGSKGRAHQEQMIFTFLKTQPNKPQNIIATNLPQFTMDSEDIASPAKVATNRLGSVTVVIHLTGSKTDELRQFTQTHLNQQVEIMFGSKVLMSPVIASVISKGDIEVSFASSDTNAQALADLLNRR